MASLAPAARAVFCEAVRSVLETWPVLQIAVDNGFGGVYSQQKAEWMVDALQQYFHDNRALEQDEVEDFVSELMNNEFDTVVDDGSLPQVAQKLCAMYQRCQQGNLAEVQEQIRELTAKKSLGRAKVTPVKVATEEEDECDDDEESMDCDGTSSADASASSAAPTQPPASSSGDAQEDDGWTVVRKKK